MIEEYDLLQCRQDLLLVECSRFVTRSMHWARKHNVSLVNTAETVNHIREV